MRSAPFPAATEEWKHLEALWQSGWMPSPPEAGWALSRLTQRFLMLGYEDVGRERLVAWRNRMFEAGASGWTAVLPRPISGRQKDLSLWEEARTYGNPPALEVWTERLLICRKRMTQSGQPTRFRDEWQEWGKTLVARSGPPLTTVRPIPFMPRLARLITFLPDAAEWIHSLNRQGVPPWELDPNIGNKEGALDPSWLDAPAGADCHTLWMAVVEAAAEEAQQGKKPPEQWQRDFLVAWLSAVYSERAWKTLGKDRDWVVCGESERPWANADSTSARVWERVVKAAVYWAHNKTAHPFGEQLEDFLSNQSIPHLIQAARAFNREGVLGPLVKYPKNTKRVALLSLTLLDERLADIGDALSLGPDAPAIREHAWLMLMNHLENIVMMPKPDTDVQEGNVGGRLFRWLGMEGLERMSPALKRKFREVRPDILAAFEEAALMANLPRVENLSQGRHRL